MRYTISGMEVQSNMNKLSTALIVGILFVFCILMSGCRKASGALLHDAIYMGDVSKVERLLNLGVDPNVLSDGYSSPLDSAISYRQPAIVKLLVEAGADLELGNTMLDWTPLCSAVVGNEIGLSKYLIDSGADIDALSDLYTALHVAVLDNNLPMVEMLLDAGANRNTVDTYGHTPLWWAERNGYQQIADMLRKE